MNIVSMAREGLRYELRSAIRQAAVQQSSVTLEGLRVKDNGGTTDLNLTVKPVRELKNLEGMLLVVFEEASAHQPEASGKIQLAAALQNDQQIAEMEQELKNTREQLHRTIEEIETSYEEVASSNEELQSSNEELQSTNEELETSKEELQSLYEELVVVNAELQTKISELSNANDDIRNLLNSTQIATIFLDYDLNIKRFTPLTTNLINLIPADIGRPLGHLVSKLRQEGLASEVRQVLDTLQILEKETQTRDGSWYLMLIMPYRTADGAIAGAVLTFASIDAQKREETKLRAINQALQNARRDYAQLVMERVPEPLLVLDGELRVITANSMFLKMFKVSAAETEGQLLDDLGNKQWNIPILHELLEKVLSNHVQFQDFMVEQDFPGIGRKQVLLDARMIDQENNGVNMILLAFEDITTSVPHKAKLASEAAKTPSDA